LQRPDDLLGLGVALVAVLGEDELAVAGNVEDAVRAFRQLSLDPQGLLDPGSQTDRPRQVVSGNAVGDDDLHAGIMPRSARRAQSGRAGPRPPWRARA
jgi:hypothetical protein